MTHSTPNSPKPNSPKPNHRAEPDTADLASYKRVQLLRQQHPNKPPDELVDGLVHRYCLQIARISVAKAGVAALPTLGMIASMAVGSMADLNATHRLQAELVLDIAMIYDYPFEPQEKQRYLALVLGLAGAPRQANNQSAAEQLIAQGGQQLTNQAAQRLTRASVGRALPVINVTRAAGSSLLMTYAAAQRAKAYIKEGPTSVGDMGSDISALLKSDELKLSEWTRESIAASMTNLSDSLMEGFDQGAQDAGRAAGRAVRKFRNFWREATKPK